MVRDETKRPEPDRIGNGKGKETEDTELDGELDGEKETEPPHPRKSNRVTPKKSVEPARERARESIHNLRKKEKVESFIEDKSVRTVRLKAKKNSRDSEEKNLAETARTYTPRDSNPEPKD